MPDVFEVADLLVSHAIDTGAEEVDIIGYYGSYAQGVATDSSDFDIFYIPAPGKNPPVGRTVLIEGILFDFWAIRWETMEGFATGRVRGWSFAPALVHHARVMHARSEQQAARLAELKQRVVDLQKPEARPQMIQRAVKMFGSVMTHVGNVRLAALGGDFADVRHAGWKVIASTAECLTLANQTFFDRGLGRGLGQLSKLRQRPADMDQLVVTISTSSAPSQIVSASEQLALSTRQVLRRFQESLSSDLTDGKPFHGNYPEIKDMIGKVLSACEQRERVGASLAAWSLQADLSMMLDENRDEAGDEDFNLYSEFASTYRRLDMPDLMQRTPGDLDTLAEQAALLDKRIRQWFCERSLNLHEYRDVEDFRSSL